MCASCALCMMLWIGRIFSVANPLLTIIDDDRELCADLEAVLSSLYQVSMAHDGVGGLALLADVQPELILLDVEFLDSAMGGLEILERIMGLDNHPTVVMLTGRKDVKTVVQAMKSGAFDYLDKPADPARLVNVLSRALVSRNRLRQIQAHRDEVDRLTGTFIAADPVMIRLLESVDKIASTNVPVLVTGESGSGKEMIARRIHARSMVSSGPFVGLNCAAIPDTMVESEIFGHKKGAFTGADSMRVGKFELASGGTIFLDEIGDSPDSFQMKLLRVIGEGVFTRLGENVDHQVNARLVAATSKNLEQAIAENKFRPELFYRLNVMRIHIPALRQRQGDIMPMALHFMGQANLRFRRTVEGFSDLVEKQMLAATWDGNIRQLRNVIERAVLHAPGNILGLGDMFPQDTLSGSVCEPYHEAKERVLQGWQPAYLAQRLKENGGNVTRAAESAGLPRTSFQKMLGKAGLKPEDFNS